MDNLIMDKDKVKEHYYMKMEIYLQDNLKIIMLKDIVLFIIYKNN